jgi:acetyl esterase/lipase
MNQFITILMTLTFCLIGSATADESKPWTINSKAIPIPLGASESLQNSLRSTDQPNTKLRKSQAPKRREDWDQLIAERAKSRSTPLKQVEQMMNVKIKKDLIDGITVYWITPNKKAEEHKNQIMLYVHGGAYVFGGGDASVTEAAIIANSSGITALSVDYRMPPDHPFPQAVDDTVRVYKEVLKDYKPSAIALGGTSAGGGLALAVTHQLKSLGLPLSGAIYAGTPWADLTKTGDTLYTNEGLDRVLVTYNGTLEGAALLYADGKNLKSPLLSPVYGDFTDFPPTILVTGTRDMFLSDTARTHQKIRASGGTADLLVFEGLSHAGYLFDLASPESRQTYQEISSFLKEHLD